MEYRVLGQTGLRVSRLALGCMTFGSQVSEEEARRMVDRALKAGVNFFDTANVYNAGISEEITGRALGGNRSAVVLATKVRGAMGEEPFQEGLSRQAILSAVEESLRRLGTDYIDVYYLHRPDSGTPLEETLAAMDTLVREGKVRYIGMSNYAAWQCAQALWIADSRNLAAPTVQQPMYNLIARGIEQEFLPFCREFRQAVVVYNPLAGGLLTGKHRSGPPPTDGSRFGSNPMYRNRYWHEESFRAVEALRNIAADVGLDLVGLSLRWLLDRSDVDCVILGASRMEQLEQNLAVGTEELGSKTHQACDDVWAGLRGVVPAYNR